MVTLPYILQNVMIFLIIGRVFDLETGGLLKNIHLGSVYSTLINMSENDNFSQSLMSLSHENHKGLGCLLARGLGFSLHFP